MNRAFIFDLDGVIINNEAMWDKAKEEIFVNFLGEKISEQMGSTLGVSLDNIYKKAAELGTKLTEEEFSKIFFKQAEVIYGTAPLTPGLDQLAKVLKDLNYAIGVVSASPKTWMDRALSRLSFINDLKVSISLYDRPDLPHKPSPVGYQEAMKSLGSTPSSTIILEDSNTGIASAKASGAYTIALTLNAVDGYEQRGADVYAKNIKDVIDVVKRF